MPYTAWSPTPLRGVVEKVVSGGNVPFAWACALTYLNRAAQLSRRQDDLATLAQELCVVTGAALAETRSDER
jgi:hypothetical protein